VKFEESSRVLLSRVADHARGSRRHHRIESGRMAVKSRREASPPPSHSSSRRGRETASSRTPEAASGAPSECNPPTAGVRCDRRFRG
jgi:hypothetical protein